MSNYNYGEKNSAANQEIKRKFVEREVFGCMTSEVEYILSMEDRNAPFEYDDIENMYIKICPECGGHIEEFENDEDETIYKCDSCEYESEDEPDSEPQEIYEWWLVSNYLADKLIEKGEPVIKGFNSYWGRGCSGQAILLDSVITAICADMEILEGQKYGWNR